MNLEFISNSLKQQASIGLPILCFSITNNMLSITTKKVASRFFEYLEPTTKYIEFRVKHRINCSDEEIETGIEFYDYILQYFESNSIINVSEFFEILNIQNIQDIVSESFSEKWNLVIVTRDPIIRLLSGFVELVDSMMGNLDTINDTTINDIINTHIGNGNHFGLKYLTTDEANQILNYFSDKSYDIIINDEHTSNWNSFISYFLTKYKGKFKIVDIDDIDDMAGYGKDTASTSNKNIYLNWLNEYSNRTYVLKFLSKLNHFLLTDYINYISLKSLK
jgi:hypothetical protein